VPAALCDGVPTDQRGYPRPATGGTNCDSGAYELFICNGSPLNTPGAFPGCPSPLSGGQTPAATPPAPNPLCAPLRKKLKKAKTKAQKRKIRKKLRKLGC
jgi:hypothetical protein